LAPFLTLKSWNAFDFLRTGSKGYQISDGDGVFYSSSVYDNHPQIRQWADSVDLFVIGETRASNSGSTPCSVGAQFCLSPSAKSRLGAH